MHAQPPRSPAVIHRVLNTEAGVYGLIVVAGIVAASGSGGAGSLRTLVLLTVTVLVFWAAHVYSGTVAEHGGHGPERVGLGQALRGSVTRSRGLIVSALVPMPALILGAVGIMTDRGAAWLALWLVVAALAALGYLAYQRKGAALHTRLIGALATASFGLAIILAKALVQH